MTDQLTIRECQRVLESTGWIVNDLFMPNHGQSFWEVHAYRSDRRIVASATSRADAWQKAVGQAQTAIAQYGREY